MAVRSITKAGQVSFRGLGWVKVDGILYPVCGSRAFNLSATSSVIYKPSQLEMVPLEEERKGMFPVFVTFFSPSSEIRLCEDGVNQLGRVLLNEEWEDGIPGGVQYIAAFSDAYSLIGPFKLKNPDTIQAVYPQGSAYNANRPTARLHDADSHVFEFANFDGALGSQFFSQIWIP